MNYVIILNFNGGEQLRRCVHSFSEIVAAGFRLLVVDNASTDCSLRAIESLAYPIEILRSKKNLGYTGGNNIGIEYALERNADFVLVVNHDVEVTNSSFIMELVEFAKQNPRAGILGPRVHIHQKNNVQNTICRIPGIFSSLTSWVMKYFRQKDVRSGNDVVKAPVLNGVCVLLRADMLREIGLFDPKIFMYREDTDLAMRARSVGWQSYYVPVDSVLHLQKENGYDYVSMVNFLLKRNAVYVLKKNGRRLDAMSMAVSVLGLSALRAARASLTRNNAPIYWRFFYLLNKSIIAVMRGDLTSPAFGPPYNDWQKMIFGVCKRSN